MSIDIPNCTQVDDLMDDLATAFDVSIALKNVGAFYWRQQGYLRREKFWALKDITFDLRQGESLGVLGRNGVGKSTLLQLLAGVLKPDKGTLVNSGASVALLSLQLGFIGHLTGRQNAYLSGMLLGLNKLQINDRIERIKQFSELDSFFEQPINTYSAGMKARLGFSVAFQVDPDILLIDEVFGVGDSEFREKSSDVLSQRIQSEKTVVMVSHSPQTISQLCNRAVWIEQGETRADGKVDDVLLEYENFLKKRKN